MVLGKVQKKDGAQSTSGWALANEHEVHEQISHFGKRHHQVRRRSSTDWEIPAGDAGMFMVKDGEDGFSVKIDLSYFQPIFTPDEVDVVVHEHDVQINARKEDPNNPNYALRELHRQYRMPDNVDLDTVKLRRGAETVNVDAKKVGGYGKPVSFQVVDVTQHRSDVHYL
uniref:SHSP domain-containing protein n=1 Tax=Steinernema glaseri TaxID=37863 RepID=A0A1I7YDD5_9BILA